MIYHVKIMPEAFDALEADAIWWAENRSPDQALRWHEGFMTALRSLNRNPERHSLAAENRRTTYELRELHFGLGPNTTHRALFRILGDSVEVLTIRHVARDELSLDDLA